MHITRIYTLLAVHLTLTCLLVAATESVNNTNEFVATKEWQVVAEGFYYVSQWIMDKYLTNFIIFQVKPFQKDYTCVLI